MMLHMLSIVAALVVNGATPEPNFEPQTIDANVAIGYGLQIGDVDGDGKPDILLADKKQFVWYPNAAPGSAWKRTLIAENLTALDDVCITARDINGDGKVEIAVGGKWNPSDTKTPASVHVLQRPADPTQPWTARELHPTEPTVHRMHWVNVGNGKFTLVVKPLHGLANDPKNPGFGPGGHVVEYTPPQHEPSAPWPSRVILMDMHVTHNFEPVRWDASSSSGAEQLLIGGLEGAKLLRLEGSAPGSWKATPLFGRAAGDADHVGIGEIRLGKGPNGQRFIATVEPFHGHMFAVYTEQGGKWQRQLVSDKFKEAHALACGDVLGLGFDQIVVGWRKPDAEKKVGIKLFVPTDLAAGNFEEKVIDDNHMACEDLKLADLNGDGKLEVIAVGRDTHNLIVYWNRR
jgi:hypothetical protein